MIRKQNESNREIVEVIDIGRIFELATTNKRYVNGLNLHEIKGEVLEDYTGDFGLIGTTMIGKLEQKTNIMFKNVDEFETYFFVVDSGGCDSEDVIFKRWLYILNTPDKKIVNRSLYARGTDFKQDIVEYIGNNCYNPTIGNCFTKRIKYFT